MGFATVSIGLGVLMGIISIFLAIKGGEWIEVGH
jgi:Na+/H+-translocating membrane pyrophosphatase